MADEQGSAETGNPETPNDAPWYGEIQDTELQGWAANKNFKSPAEALGSYRNLEKLFGADKAGRTVVLPGENAEPQELEDFYTKLGRPADVDGYELELPENADSDFVNWFKTSSHKAGLSTTQAKAIVDEYNNYVTGRVTEEQASLQQQEEAERQQLRAEWGAAYNTNLAKADAVLAQLGVSDEVVLKLKDGLGAAGTAKFFADLHTKIGEGTLVVADAQPNTGFNRPMSPTEASAKLDELKSDPKWVEAYLNGSPSHMSQKENLEKWALGG